MIVLGLAKLRMTGTDDVLIELRDDPDVQGHALEALLARKAAPPRARVEPFLTHKQTWIRKIAKRLLRYSV